MSMRLPGNSNFPSNATTASGPASITPPGPGDPDSTDSREKLEYLRPFIENASKKSGVPFNVIAALALAEGRGVSINNLSGSGVTQCGQNEFNEERQRHPEAFPPGLEWNSPEGQVLALAFRLADNHQSGDPSWDGAAARYNGGENGGGRLNDPLYLEKFHNFVEALESGGTLPS